VGSQQTPGASTGISTVSAGDGASNNGGLVTGCSLQDAPPVGWQIINWSGPVESKTSKVDYVKICALTKLQCAAIAQADQCGCLTGLALHRSNKIELRAPGSITNPVGEH
jgi:hypothetical protein